MPYINPVISNVTKQTTGSVRQGFGTQMIIDAHAWYRERSRSYSSLVAAASDMPTSSNAYKALQSAFAQVPQPTAVKVGRRQATTTLTPLNVALDTVYTINVEVNEGDSVPVSYTAGGADTAEVVATAIKTAIDAVAAVAAHVTATVVGVGAAAVLTIVAKTAVDEYAISGLGNLGVAFSTTESAADVKAAIDLQDSDYYFITSTDHTEAFVLAMGAAAQADMKNYAVAVQSEACLATLASPATDILGKLKDLGYENVQGYYAQDADTTFPECAIVANWSTTKPGTEEWYDKDILGVPEATALNGGTTAVKLSQTQKDNLVARNAGFMTTFKGSKILAGGKAFSGEWIDVVRFGHFIKARTEEVVFTYKVNQSKVPHSRVGYVNIRAVLRQELDQHVNADGNPQGLDETLPYRFTYVPGANVTLADKIDRTYTEELTLYLAGAIKNATININLAYLTQ